MVTLRKAFRATFFILVLKGFYAEHGHFNILLFPVDDKLGFNKIVICISLNR